MHSAKIIVTTIIVTLHGFGLHVLYGESWVPGILGKAAEHGAFDNLLKPPYPTYVVIMAAITALIPSAFKVLAY